MFQNISLKIQFDSDRLVLIFISNVMSQNVKFFQIISPGIQFDSARLVQHFQNYSPSLRFPLQIKVASSPCFKSPKIFYFILPSFSCLPSISPSFLLFFYCFKHPASACLSLLPKKKKRYINATNNNKIYHYFLVALPLTYLQEVKKKRRRVFLVPKNFKLRRKDPEMIRSSLEAQPYQGKKGQL